jgi:hypothetical protein
MTEQTTPKKPALSFWGMLLLFGTLAALAIDRPELLYPVWGSWILLGWPKDRKEFLNNLRTNARTRLHDCLTLFLLVLVMGFGVVGAASHAMFGPFVLDIEKILEGDFSALFSYLFFFISSLLLGSLFHLLARPKKRGIEL